MSAGKRRGRPKGTGPVQRAYAEAIATRPDLTPEQCAELAGVERSKRRRFVTENMVPAAVRAGLQPREALKQIGQHGAPSDAISALITLIEAEPGARQTDCAAVMVVELTPTEFATLTAEQRAKVYRLPRQAKLLDLAARRFKPTLPSSSPDTFDAIGHLRTLLADPKLKDSETVRTARALLRKADGDRISEDVRTIFKIPSNGKLPLQTLLSGGVLLTHRESDAERVAN